MKLPLTILFLSIALALQAAQTVPVTLGWSYPAASDIRGFRVKWGATSGSYTSSQDVAYTSANGTNYLAKVSLPPGSFVVVVALGTNGESEAGNEVRVKL